MSRLAMPPGDEPPAHDREAEKERARQALARLDQAMRDLDRAAVGLGTLDELGPEARATKQAADLVADIAHSVRRTTGTP